MFAQVIKGKAKDEAGLREQFDSWAKEVMPGTEGFLGCTTGISGDGTWVTVARFESEEAARRASDRPQQGKWWTETERYLDDVSFKDCTEVTRSWAGARTMQGSSR
jgi:hypothetical protein